MRNIALELARRLDPPANVYGILLPILRDCPEEDLQSWMGKMIDACRSSKWKRFAKEIEDMKSMPGR